MDIQAHTAASEMSLERDARSLGAFERILESTALFGPANGSCVLSELLVVGSDASSVGEEALIQLVMHGVSSPHTRRAYRTGLVEFFSWMRQTQARPTFTKALVQEYRAHLEGRTVSGLMASEDSSETASSKAKPIGEGRRLTAATINLRMATIKKLALEMADNGLLDQNVAAAIGRAKGVTQRGAKAGNWLAPQEANALLQAPDGNTRKGLRDRAILAVLVGCGLRRAELLRLRCSNMQQRDGRWVFLDILGKGNRIRTVPIPGNVKMAIDRWMVAAGIQEGPIFRPVSKAGVVSTTGIQDEKVIWRLVIMRRGLDSTSSRPTISVGLALSYAARMVGSSSRLLSCWDIARSRQRSGISGPNRNSASR
jgi:integrase/recombinase XerD